jgi:hypothetical protein
LLVYKSRIWTSLPFPNCCLLEFSARPLIQFILSRCLQKSISASWLRRSSRLYPLPFVPPSSSRYISRPSSVNCRVPVTETKSNSSIQTLASWTVYSVLFLRGSITLLQQSAIHLTLSLELSQPERPVNFPPVPSKRHSPVSPSTLSTDGFHSYHLSLY